VLDPAGGWIHAHENVAKKDIEDRKEKIVKTFKELIKTISNQKLVERWSVDCEHVELVKSYAPGVMHCVFDMAIFPPAIE
jgi:tRNA wybutosine-synthesizing protein 2